MPTPPITSQGGKRKNAGRKQYYNEPTVTVAFKVPVSKKKEIKQFVKDYLLTLRDGQ
jgi:hypothetical protein